MPMVTVWALVRNGSDPRAAASASTTGSGIMMALWWLTPVTFGVIQLCLLRLFTLHGPRLEKLRRDRELLDSEKKKD